ncbi:protein HEXIM1-like [Ornithodoros turicata]|uniref:Putative negative regulation of cyclin-dependent protein kinase n=1 Tax=Ornithodoros turicata TaxID=34597 RepID=A0A2R5L9Q2_9ACAR
MGEVEVLRHEDPIVATPPQQQTTSGSVPGCGLPLPGGHEEQHEEDDQQTPSDHGQDNGGKRKKNRRGKNKKRKWKPYYKLSWEERRELEERESRRANKVRAQMFAHGLPVAPYNTTQFLMEDHCVQEPDYEHIVNGGHRHRDNSINSVNSIDSSDEFYSSPEDEDDFLQKQFSEAYDDIHAERLNSMSKTELVQEYLLLEDRVQDLEHKLRESRTARLDVETQTTAEETEEQLQKISIFKEEIRKLADENVRIRAENKALRELVTASPSSSS